VLAARGESLQARAALSDLCSAYYEPVVAFLRARFRDEDRARESAHEFFARLLERNSLAGADQGRGRFRSYLLGAVKHFIADHRDRELAAKRGAGAEHVAIEAGTDTSPGVDPPATPEQPPEVEFDRQWAMTMLDRAMKQLSADFAAAGNVEHFNILKPWLTGGGSDSQADAALRLGLNEGAVKVAIHRLRKRFRDLVKTEIAHTVEDASEVAGEMNYLVTVLSN
jgi:DNA-directed RNA polymerase specialized sigma24 family protein